MVYTSKFFVDETIKELCYPKHNDNDEKIIKVLKGEIWEIYWY